MAPTTAAAQQSDNVAHALSGAGGGILSMALTYVYSQELVVAIAN
jgi:adenine nucleotide transporter 17